MGYWAIKQLFIHYWSNSQVVYCCFMGFQFIHWWLIGCWLKDHWFVLSWFMGCWFMGCWFMGSFVGWSIGHSLMVPSFTSCSSTHWFPIYLLLIIDWQFPIYLMFIGCQFVDGWLYLLQVPIQFVGYSPIGFGLHRSVLDACHDDPSVRARADLPMWEGDRHFVPLVFDDDPRAFHGTMPYDRDQPKSWTYERL